jgi:hypothetical protein
MYFLSLLVSAILAASPVSTPLQKTDSLSLPTDVFDEHALKSHADALRTRDLFKRGMCSPIVEYACPSTARLKFICKVDPYKDLPSSQEPWAGVVIGKRSGQLKIITAFVASRDYWLGSMAADGCYPIFWTP